MEHGLTEDKIAGLDAEAAAFSPREKLAIDYAQKLAEDHHRIDDAFFERLREEFSDPEIVELGMMIGQYIGFGRLLKVLDLEPKFCPTDEPPAS
ncbi:MAG: carboxymuconolactone decarboxylase family protein [Pseudomonadales bacterium]